jgi:hypothetical protein
VIWLEVSQLAFAVASGFCFGGAFGLWVARREERRGGPLELLYGLPCGWVAGDRGVAAVLVILDGSGDQPSAAQLAVLAKMAAGHAERSC